MKRNMRLSKKYFFFLLIILNVLFAVNFVNGATYYSRGSLPPNLTTSWAVNTNGSGSQPGNFTTSGDIFVVQNGHTMTMTANWSVTGNIVINNGGILTAGAYSITITGTTTVGGGSSGRLNISSTTGAKTFIGLVTINDGATWNNSANEAVTFRGGIDNNGTFTAGTAVHTFIINAQAISGTISIPRVTITGVELTNNGVLTVGTALAGTGGLTNSSSGILNLGGTSAITTLTATAAGNTVIFYRNGNQSAKVTTYNNLTLSGSGTKTFATTPTVNGILSMEGTATIVVTGAGVVTYGENAMLQYNKTAAYTATLEEFPATFSGSGGVSLINTGVITFGAAKSITNNLSIAPGASVNLGTFTNHTAGSLTFGENSQLCGTWGSTTATSATYHNNSYFAGTTGYISVGSVPASPTGVTPGSGVAICSGSGINLNATSSGNTIYWYTESTGGISIGSTTSGEDFFITPTGNTTYYAETQTPGGCVSVTRTPTALITVSAPVPDFDASTTDANCSTSADGSIEITNPVPIQFNDPDFIEIGSSLLSNRNLFTLEGWIKVDLNDIGSRISLFGQNDAIEFGFMSSTSLTCWTASGGSVSANNIYPSDNGWHHVAAVGNGTNIILYIDGTLVASGGSGTGNYGSDANYTSKIGAGVWDASGGYFPGQMLKAGFWNVALSATQISNLATDYYQYTDSESGLMAGYNFFEGTGTTLGSVITGTNGNFNGTPTWTDIFTYAWTKTDDAGYSASTKNISTLTTGEYNLTITNGSCSRTESFTVSSILPVFESGTIFTDGETICSGGDPEVIGNSTAASGGDGSITYEWRANGTPISSSNSATYDPPTGLTTTTTYTRWAKDGTCNTTFTQSTGSWVVTVDPLPTITTLPIDLTVCEGESGNFTVATSASSPTYQWGYATSPTPASWIDVPEGGDISGTETAELDLANIPVGYNGFYVSCLINANGCETRTIAVLLTVNPLPTTGEIIPD